MPNAAPRTVELMLTIQMLPNAPTAEFITSLLMTQINGITDTQLRTARLNGMPFNPTTPYAPEGVRLGEVL